MSIDSTVSPEMNITPSLIDIISSLIKGPKTPQDIRNDTGLAGRTVTLGLRELRERGYITKSYNLNDMRKPLYKLDQSKISDLRERHIETFRKYRDIFAVMR